MLFHERICRCAKHNTPQASCSPPHVTVFTVEYEQQRTNMNQCCAPYRTTFLPERDYAPFGYMLSQIRFSSSASNVRAPYTQPVETFRTVSMPFWTLAIR